MKLKSLIRTEKREAPPDEEHGYKMKRLVVKGARVLDPATGLDAKLNIIAMGGRFASIRPPHEDDNYEGAEWDVVEAEGLLVVPGLIDIHTHLREPGFEYKEDIESGAKAAAAGGFTTILCMANTEPVNDSASVTRLITKRAAAVSPIKVLPIGALTKGLEGRALSEMGELKDAGCVAFSDDGMPVKDPAIMRRALEYSTSLNLPVISHAEEPALTGGGVMNEGVVSTRMGLKGIPNASEDVMVARDIALAELTGARLHIAHVSTRGAVDLIRAAKARGAKVTCEAAPHHLTLDHGAVVGYDTFAKMSPPLRAEEDIAALHAALKDGTIDAIATDHAPHSSIEKDVEFDAAANGIVGLETALGLTLGLVGDGIISLAQAVTLLTSGPARAMGINSGTLKIGASADMTIIDPDMEWVVEPEKFLSKSRNTPYGGRAMKGRAIRTIVGGETVYEMSAEG